MGQSPICFGLTPRGGSGGTRNIPRVAPGSPAGLEDPNAALGTPSTLSPCHLQRDPQSSTSPRSRAQPCLDTSPLRGWKGKAFLEHE